MKNKKNDKKDDKKKIKNLEINLENVVRVAACCVLVCVAVKVADKIEFTEDRNNILKGTILENSCVVTFEDGSKDIAVAIGKCDGFGPNHYYSVTSGEYFGNIECRENKIEGNVVHHYEIDKEENITSYLTSDELARSMQGELYNDDIINIINRTVEPLNEEKNTRAR